MSKCSTKSVNNRKGSFKDKLNSSVSRFKKNTKEYGDKVHNAYNVGYSSGVNDYKKLPKTFGAQTSATVGYSKGLKDTSKNEKYNNKLKNKKGR